MCPRDPDLERDEEFEGNSGYLLFIRPEHLRVWPTRMIEVQGMNRDVLNVLGRNKMTVDADARKRAIRPLGRWNSVEIASRDGRVTSSLNGVVVSTLLEHQFTEPGHIGFQSEGVEIRWRNIRIRRN